MTVAKVVSASYGNLGIKGTKADNEMVAIDGVILTTSDYSASIANAALEATWEAGIKAGTVMPLVGLDSYEDQSSEDTIYESALGKRKLLKRGKTRYMFQLDVPLSVHRTLMTDFNSADLRMYPIRDGKICFYNDSGTAKGFSTSMINIGRMKEVPADGATPAFTPVYIDLDNYREWDMYGEFIEPTWNVNDLRPLTDVVLVIVGQPTASALVVKVYAADGYDAAGAVKEVLISGLVVGDFMATLTGGVDQTAALDTVTSSGGTYTFVCTTLANGTVNLKAPADMTSGAITDYLVKSSGAATISGIA